MAHSVPLQTGANPGFTGLFSITFLDIYAFLGSPFFSGFTG
jgi:hypothetical protein